ncbi:hypothetical protein ABW20_dc0101836 [Dactylellina cionopaga]|nr:hypothetical protein ABW20_dc0101836 [Dactylellina cionopaga]
MASKISRRLLVLGCLSATANIVQGYAIYFQEHNLPPDNFQYYDFVDRRPNACHIVTSSYPAPAIDAIGLINGPNSGPDATNSHARRVRRTTDTLRAMALYKGINNSECVGTPDLIVRFEDPTDPDQVTLQVADLNEINPSAAGVYRFWKPMEPEVEQWAHYVLKDDGTGFIINTQEGLGLPVRVDLQGNKLITLRNFDFYTEAEDALFDWIGNAPGRLEESVDKSSGFIEEENEISEEQPVLVDDRARGLSDFFEGEWSPDTDEVQVPRYNRLTSWPKKHPRTEMSVESGDEEEEEKEESISLEDSSGSYHPLSVFYSHSGPSGESEQDSESGASLALRIPGSNVEQAWPPQSQEHVRLPGVDIGVQTDFEAAEPRRIGRVQPNGMAQQVNLPRVLPFYIPRERRPHQVVRGPLPVQQVVKNLQNDGQMDSIEARVSRSDPGASRRSPRVATNFENLNPFSIPPFQRGTNQIPQLTEEARRLEGERRLRTLASGNQESINQRFRI